MAWKPLRCFDVLIWMIGKGDGVRSIPRPVLEQARTIDYSVST